MKQLTKITFLFFMIAFAFSACTEEDYADWKILNDNKYAAEVAAKTDYKKTESGLCYKILYGGMENGKRANIDSYVTVNYTLKLMNGKVVQTGTYTGTLTASDYGGTIKAWQEAIPMLYVKGEMDMFFLYDLGYGSAGNGSIPPYSMLYYSITLVDAKN